MTAIAIFDESLIHFYHFKAWRAALAWDHEDPQIYQYVRYEVWRDYCFWHQDCGACTYSSWTHTKGCSSRNCCEGMITNWTWSIWIMSHTAISHSSILFVRSWISETYWTWNNHFTQHYCRTSTEIQFSLLSPQVFVGYHGGDQYKIGTADDLKSVKGRATDEY